MNNHIQYFPSNILNKIFSFVNDVDKCNSVPFVCEKWRLALSQSQLLKNASFEGRKITNTDHICELLSSSEDLRSVSLSAVADVIPVLRHICRYNKHIDKLVLKNCSQEYVIPEDVLVNLLLTLTNLKSLEFYNIKFKSKIFYEIAAKQTNITSIDLSLNEYVTVNDLMMLAHNRRLEEFKMSRRLNEPEITDEEMCHLIKAMQPTLTLLHLDMSNLGNLTYQSVFDCSRLTNLKMNNSVNLSADLLKLLPSLKNLRKLKIEGPSLISPGDLYNLFASDSTWSSQLICLKLEYFFSLENYECSQILKLCYSLKNLSLEGCRSISLDYIYDALMDLHGLIDLNLAFIGNSKGINRLIESCQMSSLAVDELSYVVHDISKVITNIFIKKLRRKCKKM